MTKPLLSLVFVAIASLVAPAHAQTPNVVTRESTLTARVDRLDRTARSLTLRTSDNVTQMMYVDPSVTLFDELKAGDQVTVRYTDSVVVQVRPGAALSSPRDTTEAARKRNQDVLEQLTSVVTVEDINAQDQMVVIRDENGMKAVRYVADKQLLQGIRRGDRVEVTRTRERAVDCVVR